jgi:hypothetical protein
MRELVRRGVSALPSPIRHLQDKRPTKLSIGRDFFFMFAYFSDEYDWRVRPRIPVRCDHWCFADGFALGKPLTLPYSVRVGDVCYVLIGQIVNRDLVAVRYQPTGGLVVNSPLEAPNLVERINKDWTGLDARSHEASLLTDIRAGESLRFFGPALARLRFYYPDAYAALRDQDLGKREAFEASEKAQETAN